MLALPCLAGSPLLVHSTSRTNTLNNHGNVTHCCLIPFYNGKSTQWFPTRVHVCLDPWPHIATSFEERRHNCWRILNSRMDFLSTVSCSCKAVDKTFGLKQPWHWVFINSCVVAHQKKSLSVQYSSTWASKPSWTGLLSSSLPNAIVLLEEHISTHLSYAYSRRITLSGLYSILHSGLNETLSKLLMPKLLLHPTRGCS